MASPALKSTLTELLPRAGHRRDTFVIELHHLHVAGNNNDLPEGVDVENSVIRTTLPRVPSATQN